MADTYFEDRAEGRKSVLRALAAPSDELVEHMQGWMPFDDEAEPGEIEEDVRDFMAELARTLEEQ